MPDPNIYTSKLNTGKITFNNGIKIIGALEGSSDGEGCDTIELVPDINQYDLGQYLVIEPNLNEDRIHIRAGGTVDESTAKLVLGGVQTHLALNDQDTNRVSIRTKNTAEDGSHVWNFTSDGTTGFPELTISTLQSGTINAETLQFANSGLYSVITGPDTPAGDDVNPILVQGKSGNGGAGGSIYLWGGNSNSVYEAGSIDIRGGDGTTSSTDPGAIQIIGGNNLNGGGGTVTIQGGAGSNILANGSVYIKTGSNTWDFFTDGSTGFPSLNVDLHTGGSTLVEAIKFRYNTVKSVITGATPATGVAAKPLIVQGQSQTGAAGGDVCLWGGDSTTAGGNIEILAGDNDGSSGTAGIVTIKGGDGATGGAGGNVAITGGTGTTHGQVTITSNSNTWTFKNDGSVTIPNAKDIQDIAGNTVIGGGNRVKNYNSSSGGTVPVDENNIYAINTTTQATTVKLPASGTTPIGYEFTVIDTIGNAASKNITVIAESGDSIVSAPSGIAIDTNYGLLAFKYIGNKNWAILYGR